jgi:hypothetical protein
MMQSREPGGGLVRRWSASCVRHAELRCYQQAPVVADLLAPGAADFHQGGERPRAAGRRLRVFGRRLPR